MSRGAFTLAFVACVAGACVAEPTTGADRDRDGEGGSAGAPVGGMGPVRPAAGGAGGARPSTIDGATSGPAAEPPGADASASDLASGDAASDGGTRAPADAVATDSTSDAPGAAPVRSDGCGKPSGEAKAKWVEKALTVGTADRRYWIWLPKTYDPARSYKTVLLLHGCGEDAWRQTNNVPMERVTGEDAIVVRGYALGMCWQYSATGPDMDYFDALVKKLGTDHCVDRSRIFAVGYSSGSWFINLLNCIRTDVLRAAGTLTGGQPSIPATCGGAFPQIFIHDLDDKTNVISGSRKARDRLLKSNMCTATTAPSGPTPCVRYQGCTPGFPVDWCETSGEGHGRQDGLVPAAVWRFFSGF